MVTITSPAGAQALASALLDAEAQQNAAILRGDVAEARRLDAILRTLVKAAVAA